ncbi:MAG: InlB B-repeat-containing protein [Eubacterium sp.]
MERIVKKSVIIVLSIIVAMTMIPVMSSYAGETEGGDNTTYSFDNALACLTGDTSTDADGDLVVKWLSPDTVIKNVYWNDLEEGTVEGCYGVFPKYLTRPDQTALKGVSFKPSNEDETGSVLENLPCSGISPNALSMQVIDYDGFERLGYLVGQSNIPDESLSPNDAIPAKVNPFGFKESDVLTQDEIKEPSKLTAYADLKSTENQNSSAVGEYSQGQAINLGFTLNASWIRRYINGDTLDLTRTGFDSKEHIDSIYNNTTGQIDSEFVFTVDIPDGVTVNNPGVTLKGLEGFTPSATVETDSTTKKKSLVIRVRPDAALIGDSTLWKDILAKFNKVDTSNVEVSISGLSVRSDAEPESEITLRGTASGYCDWNISDDKFFEEKNSDGNTEYKPYNRRVYMYFAAKQRKEGRDAALPSDGSRDNMISYSFKVSKPSTPDTPYVPSTPTEPQQPQKHEVTIHEDNPTTDKPETTTKITVDDQGKVEKPAQDPVRPGYTFDGWYSDPECTIPFDFSKPVTGDLHIYAKWNKNVKPQTARKVTGILLPKAIANGSSRQTVTWTPLTNVDGYYVYEANCNTPKKTYHFKKVADVKASAPRVYKQSGLKKGVAYKYYVAAYQIKNGKKKVVKKSLSVHSIAGNIMRKHVNYTNVKSVSVRKNAVTLKVGKTYRIQPAVKGVFSNCAILQKGHAAMFRYVYIKDGKNISVSSTGVVKAKKAGKCNVYVLGTNGVRARVAVTVK